MNSNTLIMIAGLGTCIATVYLAFFAYAQVVISKRQNQQKSTIQVLISNSSSSFYRHQRQKYLNMRRNGENFTALACKINEKGDEEKNLVVLDVLNSVEFICVGIKEGIFDEAVYKRMSRSSVIHDWNTLKPYIMELRRLNNNNDKLFCEFEWLAQKWIKDDE